jgi:WD40 repeat protein
MNIDGSDTVQLTHGRGENVPRFHRRQMVVYTSASDCPCEGADRWGEAVRLADEGSCWPTVSPDGKWIAYFKVEGSPHPHYKVAVIPFEGGKPVKLFDAAQKTPPSLDVRWTPDGEGLAYTVNHNDVSNIWIQPLDGSPRRQMSNFASDQIFSFTWSPDGKLLACERGGWKGDIVLIRNLR